ncbi:MAG: hypothetical protein KAT77_05970 [Nanoarchaeota archaeon]|nr:hypothetical protein [Nanoarchaeota archaeon]
MKRKLIQLGEKSLLVSLPAKWIKLRGLKKGDEIDLKPVENSLLLSPEVKLEKKSARLKVTSENRAYIRMILNALYRSGYDKLTILFENPPQLKLIKKTIDTYYLGFDITTEKDDYIIIENITEPSQEKQEVLLRRVFLLIKEAFELIHTDLNEEKYENFRTIENLKNKSNKYNNFCRRQIAKQRLISEKTYFYWGLYSRFLVIQHTLRHLYKYLHENKKFKISNKTKNIFKQVYDIFDQVYHAFFKKDLKTLQKIFDQSRDLNFKDLYQALQQSKGKESVILHHIGEINRFIYMSMTPMFGILFNQTI